MAKIYKIISVFAAVVNCQFDTCGKSRSCMMLPDNCQPGGGKGPCNGILWNTESDGIHVTISGEITQNAGDWVGIGFTEKTGSMNNSDIYICKRLSTELQFNSAFAAKNGPPTEYPTTNGAAPGVVTDSIEKGMSGNRWVSMSWTKK